MSILDLAADRQAVWAATANALKANVVLGRRTAFLGSVCGALGASLASVLAEGTWRTGFAIVGAVALAISGIVSSRMLGREVLARHFRARVVSEALKREAFLYATEAGPYRDLKTRDSVLSERMREIEGGVVDLVRLERPARGPGSAPRRLLSLEEYIASRIEVQRSFYLSRAEQYGRPASILHAAELFLAFAAAVLTAVAGVLGKGSFDFAAITAVITTIAGLLLAHLQASRYDELVAGYRAAANQLAHLRAVLPSEALVSRVAEEAEAVIAAETNSWQAMWNEK